jgi:hypothetical protein
METSLESFAGKKYLIGKEIAMLTGGSEQGLKPSCLGPYGTAEAMP